jgi:predicted PurR-regulated permease PerM
MLVEGPTWLKRIWRIYDDQQRMERHKRIAGRMYNVVTGYVTGQLTVSAIGASVTGIVVFLLSFFFNVPGNLALPAAAIAFTLSLIPMFGATIAGALISLLLLFNDTTAGVIFVVFFILYQQVENNFVSPAIQAKKVELSALAILVSVAIGLYVFGLAGGIISIPIAGSIKVLLEEHLSRAKEEREKSAKPLAKLVKKLHGES